MHYNKLPLSILDQFNLLSKRGLVFEDENLAIAKLKNVSYYRLRAYTFSFQDNSIENHPFLPNISFEKILQLYYFDQKLRLLIFDAIEKIEVSIRTQVIYNFAIQYGSHWPFESLLFRDSKRFKIHNDSLIKEIERSNETFIKHYLVKYDSPKYPPSWMSLEVSSMGLLSKIFQNLKKCPAKIEIVKHFGLNDISILENWLHCFSTLRNI